MCKVLKHRADSGQTKIGIGSLCDITDVSEIKKVINKQFTVCLGGNIAQFYIANENHDTSSDITEKFFVAISNQAHKDSLPYYESVLHECIDDYNLRRKFYMNEAKLSLEQLLKYCIIVNGIKIAGFYKLDNIITIK